VLAVVDPLGGGVGGRKGIGRGPSAQERPGLVEIDVEAGRAAGGGGGQPGQPAAGDD